MVEGEGWLPQAQLLADQEFERRLGRFVGVARVFPGHDHLQDLLQQAAVPQLGVLAGQFGLDVGPPRQFRDQHPAGVANLFRLRVFVGPGQALDGTDVDPALVGEGRPADVGLVGGAHQVDAFPDGTAGLRQARQTAFRQTADPEFQFGIGDHRRQIDVAAAFADAVDGPLDLEAAGLDGGQGIGDRQPAVVVDVDAQLHAGDAPLDGGDPGPDFLGQTAAVGVAQDQAFGAGLPGGLNGVEGVGRIGLPAIEEVLGVIEYGAARGLLQKGHARRDHRQVVGQLHPQGFHHVEVPGFPEDADDIGL